MKLQEKQLKKLSVGQLRKLVREEYARGVPDFVTSNAASNCAEEMKRHLIRYVQQNSADPSTSQRLMKLAALHLENMEEDIKKVIENHMLLFFNDQN